jgi:hypothetical protein
MLIIETYADLYPHIKDYPWLKVNESNEITSINYYSATHAVSNNGLPLFPNPYALKCKGIKFNTLSGTILARLFHKFFSLNETSNDINRRSIKKAKVVEKLSGTMVFPLIHPVTNDVRLCAETGTIDDVAIMTETLCNVPINTLRVILNEGYTPIFEFIVPYGRNIIKFDRSSLTLLAVRNTITDTYINNLSNFSQRLGIPILIEYSGQLALDTLRNWKSNKDIILMWDDGYQLKICEYILNKNISK